MKISVIGTGYIGLVTACCFAEKGHEVVGVDEDRDKVAALKAGGAVMYEPGLDELLARNVAAGRLRFTDSIGEGVAASEVLFLCVGTPPRPDGAADLSQIENVARQVAEHMDGYRLLVEKSTVPVQTAQWVARTLRLYNRGGADFDVASNPEFTREGSAVADFLEPDRIVIGVDSPRAERLLAEIYADFDCPKVVTDVSTAEIIKHASNSFLAMKISYINLMAEICEAAGGDVRTVAEGMGLDARIGRAFLNAGLGYGGSCFPKDVQAFIRIGEDLGVDMSLLRAVHDSNERRVTAILQKLRRALWIAQGKTIALWGLAFKPETDDIRGAPALALGRLLLDEGAALRLHDPQAMERVRAQWPDSERVVYCPDPVSAADGANALVLVTEWDCFRQADLAAVAQRMATPVLIDGRNALDAAAARAAGFEYYGCGCGDPASEPIGAA